MTWDVPIACWPGVLVGRQGEWVHQRWIEGRQVAPEPILGALENGPVADAAAMYEAVVKMRRAPIGKVSVIGIVLPLALPLGVVATQEVPLKDSRCAARRRCAPVVSIGQDGNQDLPAR